MSRLIGFNGEREGTGGPAMVEGVDGVSVAAAFQRQPGGLRADLNCSGCGAQRAERVEAMWQSVEGDASLELWRLHDEGSNPALCPECVVERGAS
jgi:hypothetical protein